MLARLERMDTPRGRLIATSDIHGSLKLFNELLELIRLTDEDALVIVGDMCERGEDSLGVIRRAMELSRRGNVRVLAGNKDLRDRIRDGRKRARRERGNEICGRHGRLGLLHAVQGHVPRGGRPLFFGHGRRGGATRL